MRILGIDTSTERTSIGLIEGDRTLAQAEHVDARGHVEAIAALFAQIPTVHVNDSDFLPPDLIAVGVGPGSFTGLRVGIAFAQSLARAWNIPAVGICSLDALALTVMDAHLSVTGDFVVATDARRHELYWARYNAHGCITQPAVALREVVGAMDGELFTDLYPSGSAIARCVNASTDSATGSWSQQRDLTPLYLREPDAQPTAARPAKTTSVQ